MLPPPIKPFGNGRYINGVCFPAAPHARRACSCLYTTPLAGREKIQAVYYNAVANVKLDPQPSPIPLLKLTREFQPNAEIKRGFGACIARFSHSLDKYQVHGKNLKPSSVTHLCFGTGALGSTGNRSPQEARTAWHEFRLKLHQQMGIRTDFRRFIITNMVCSTTLGFCVDLARMHAEDPDNRSYEPEVFPASSSHSRKSTKIALQCTRA